VRHTSRTLDRLAGWLPILILGGLAALTYWLDAQVRDPGPGRDGSGRHDPDMFAEGVRAVELDADGRPTQRLSAARARHYPDDGTVEFEGPKLSVTRPDQPSFTIEAQRARISGDRENAYFEGSVRALREPRPGSGDDARLTLATEYLHVIPKQDRAQTDKPVTIEEGRGIIRATGLVLDNASKTLKLKSEVRGTMQPSTLAR
jgi:lipopolysaccharide export system protein LptC